MHCMTLGDFELTILSDGTYMNDGGAMFGVIPKIMWEKRAVPDERNRIPLALNSLLVRTGQHNVLIDTGIGNKLNDKRRAIYDNQELLLESFGISFKDIQKVIVRLDKDRGNANKSLAPRHAFASLMRSSHKHNAICGGFDRSVMIEMPGSCRVGMNKCLPFC